MSHRRYISADHAVATYRKMRAQVGGCKAFDYEQPQVDSQAAPENPHLDKLDDLWLLERIFCSVYMKVGSATWTEWQRIKLMDGSVTSMERVTLSRVNGQIEEGLAREGRLVQSAVR